MKRSAEKHRKNSYVACYVHVVFSTTHRERLIIPEIRDRLYRYIAGTLKMLDCTPININGLIDHVHILMRLSPTHALSDVIREVKKSSSRHIKGVIPAFEWQTGYSAFSVSAGTLRNVYKYISNQENHHRTRSYLDEIKWLEEWNMSDASSIDIDDPDNPTN